MYAKETFGRVKIGTDFNRKELLVFLEHSCDEWIIGDLDKAKEFLKELQQAIDYCEKK